jgi:hypothetical protein
VLVAAFLAFGVGAPPALAQPPKAHVLPLQSHPFGKTYGQWAARWWQWALAIPASADSAQNLNPLLDETGADCAEGQSGKVWFLAGVFNATGSAERRCTVPVGTALFFPILNYEADNFACVDPNTHFSTDELRALAAGVMDQATNLSASVDGAEVANVERYRSVSPVFTVALPAQDLFKAFGCTDSDSYPSRFPAVDDGYYLMLAPLPPGEHTIRFHGEIPGVFTLDIIYHLTVQTPGNGKGPAGGHDA